jgi:hypothetical protein
VEITTKPGSLGQYEVVVDGETVAQRTRGLAAMFGGGWPTADQVDASLESRLPGR